MMKTIYATSLYLLITCLTSVIGADIAPIENTQFKLCFYVSNLGPYDPLTVSVIYFDCKFNLNMTY